MSNPAGSDGSGADDPTGKPRRRFLRFLLVGSANASIDLGIYLALTAVGLGLFVSNLISTTCGLTFSFFANRSFTFGVRSSTRRAAAVQATLFVAVVGIGLWVIQPLVIAGSTSILELWFTLPGWAVALLSKVAAIGVALVWNYSLFRLVVFRPRPGPTPVAPRN